MLLKINPTDIQVKGANILQYFLMLLDFESYLRCSVCTVKCCGLQLNFLFFHRLALRTRRVQNAIPHVDKVVGYTFKPCYGGREVRA